MEKEIKDKVWEVIVEQIQLKPESRIEVKMTSDELIKALEDDGIDHIVSVSNIWM